MALMAHCSLVLLVLTALLEALITEVFVLTCRQVLTISSDFLGLMRDERMTLPPDLLLIFKVFKADTHVGCTWTKQKLRAVHRSVLRDELIRVNI